ncbi:MAG: hypothetical protein PVH87_00365 [Desulfobacteraceae bacterium]|jgi:hypothetical protein
MTEKKRPNVTGKGPALAREIIEIFGQILSDGGSMKEMLESQLADRGAELQKIIKMAYLKTVKAGEVAWDLKEMSLELKAAVEAGDEAKAKELLESVTADMDHLIHKIKTFVVRMT